MAIFGDLFNLVDVSTFDAFSAILIICFIIWEIPRSIKLMDEEYTRGLYPENGRVADFVLLVIGLLSIFYFTMDNNAWHIVDFLKSAGFLTAIFLIIMLAIPLIVVLGYFKRFFARIDKHESVTVFVVHAVLDLVHTLFQISLVVLFVPVVGHLIFGN